MPKVDTQAAYGVGLYGGAARGRLYTDLSVGKSNLGAGVCCFDRSDMILGARFYPACGRAKLCC
jgi:hypothetical protein